MVNKHLPFTEYHPARGHKTRAASCSARMAPGKLKTTDEGTEQARRLFRYPPHEQEQVPHRGSVRGGRGSG